MGVVGCKTFESEEKQRIQRADVCIFDCVKGDLFCAEDVFFGSRVPGAFLWFACDFGKSVSLGYDPFEIDRKAGVVETDVGERCEENFCSERVDGFSCGFKPVGKSREGIEDGVLICGGRFAFSAYAPKGAGGDF